MGVASYGWLADMQAQEAAAQATIKGSSSSSNTSDAPPAAAVHHVSAPEAVKQLDVESGIKAPQPQTNAQQPQSVEAATQAARQAAGQQGAAVALSVVVERTQKDGTETAVAATEEAAASSEDPHWVRKSLLRPDFLMPAVAGAMAFCNMAGVMVSTPVAMSLVRAVLACCFLSPSASLC